ncbi:elicitor-responsive protein 3 [Tanacetum coccineum]
MYQQSAMAGQCIQGGLLEVTDGGKSPTFQEKFVFTLIEGLRDVSVSVWNSNTISHDDYIGGGRIPLTKVFSQGFDDSSWPLQSKTGRHAGEVRLIMHYSNTNNPGAQKPSKSLAPQGAPSGSMYPAAPLSMYGAPPPGSMYPAPPPGSMYPSYPPNASAYPPTPYPNQMPNYPPTPYPYGSQYPPGSPFPGTYPPPPY